MIMDIKEIQRYLPHRYPFLLIDRVVELELGKRIVAQKNVTMNEAQFQGHFPENPLFPGVLVIEAMAQAAAILGFKTAERTIEDGYLYLFAGADKVKFRRQIIPGDVILLEASYLSHKRHIWKFECRALVDGQVAASAVLTCAEQKIK